ncbi:hypothetical protein [Paenibacillus rubinfantis]|uniref:hypothetical protein n=1 Tax=Paenibacillus rubinfantis TaxID=1720296 RepID=UPI000B2CC190|nr:hypothetical protein [Paenibacillus rubinfantis]
MEKQLKGCIIIHNYTIHDEIRSVCTPKWFLSCLVIMLLPMIYFLLRHSQYTFNSEYDVFTFFLDSFVPIVFVIFAVFVYTGMFAQEVNNRFIVYTRLRISLKKLLRIKIVTNFVLTFGVFFIFIFAYFIFAYYVEPVIGLVRYDPSFFALNGTTVQEYTLTQNTFSQLLAYGEVTYGFIYSLWVAINAALFATFALLLVLLLDNKFLALSIPFGFYLVESFFMGAFGMVKYQFFQAIFPFNYMQLPIWTSLVPTAALIIVCLFLLSYLILANRLDRMQ